MNIEQLIRFLNLDEIDEKVRFEIFCEQGHVPEPKYKWVTKNRKSVYSNEYLNQIVNGEKEIPDYYFDEHGVVN